MKLNPVKLTSVVVVLLLLGVLAFLSFRISGPDPQTAEPVADAAGAQQQGQESESVTSVLTGGLLSVTESVKLKIDFRDSVDRIHALRGTQLDPAGIRELQDFLRDPEIPAGLNASQYRFLVNAIMNELRQQGDQSGLVAVLSQVARDPRQDEVVRDYALQHQGSAMERLLREERVTLIDAAGATSSQDIPELKQQIESALWESATAGQGTIGGTALLALEEMSSRMQYWEESDPRRAEVTRLAVEMAGNPQASEMARVTALQVAARGEQGQDILPVARELAASPVNLALRLSAVAALGYQGTEQDREFLEQLADQGDKRLQVAAAAALKRMEKRNGVLL